jgi:predicted DNA-binding transcriptional regulator AlpA
MKEVHTKPKTERMLLNQNATADYLGVSRMTAWKWRKLADFPAPVVVNGTSRYDKRDLDKWIESRKQGVWTDETATTQPAD